MEFNLLHTVICICMFFLRIIDKIASTFGHKLCQVTYESIFDGQSPEVLKEARHPDIVDPLNLMIDALRMDNQVDVVGRFMLIHALRETIIHRVEIQKALKENPEILKGEIKRPIFIVGFPRSGTTMLYHLLGQDPQFHSPMFWELIEPYPAGRLDNWRQSKRFRTVKRNLEIGLMLSSEEGMDAAHRMRAESPEECIIAMGRSFLQYHYFLRLVSFTGLEEWFYKLTHQQITNIYRYYKTQLQLMGYKHLDHQSYLLKSHIHLMGLDALLEVFPDACLVFTYRPVTEILPSHCSTILQGTSNFGPADDKFGKRVTRMLSEFANRSAATMKRYQDVPEEKNPFYVVAYDDLVKDPMATVRQIYDKYGFTYTSEAETKQRTWLASNPKNKHGKHEYSMEQFGLTEEDIKAAFKPYVDFFKHSGKKLI